MVLAMASSLYNVPLDSELFAFGEIGLSAEIRAVPQAQRRVVEAVRLGLKKCVLPEACLEGLKIPEGMNVIGVRTLRQAINKVLTKPSDKHRLENVDLELETILESD